MSVVFTLFVDTSDPGRDLCEAVLKKLRGILRRELIKRSMWDYPPSYLGIYGEKSWSEGDALEDLVMECYVVIFCDRMETLKKALKANKQAATPTGIEGLVVTIIKNFIYDRGRGDKIGHNTFCAFHCAVSECVSCGDPGLFVVEGNPLIRSDTILGFSPEMECSPDFLPTAEDLEDLVKVWVNDMLPGLVIAQGKAKRRIIEELKAKVLTLQDRGIKAFRFKDLLRLIKSEVRGRWNVVWHTEVGTTAVESDEDSFNIIRRIDPPTTFEDRQSFRAVLACVEQAIENLGQGEKNRRHLWKLWNLSMILMLDEPPRLLSQRKASTELKIPRPRLKILLEILRGMVEACRRSVGYGSLSGDFDKE